MSNPKKMKKMKRFLLSLGLIAMAFNLTNCAKYEEVTPAIEAKGDFAIYAPITRTVNNDMNTSWVAKDEINLFHAVGETADYVNDTPYLNNAGCPFVCENAAEGYFLGSLYGTLDPEEEYDWYAFYPYSSYIKTPANDNSGYTNIGSKAGTAQVQNGNNSMAHIAGTNYPMAGYAVAIPGGQQPTLEFKHISSLIEFEVVNKLAEAITVTEIQFIAEEDIVGSFYINFAKPEAMKFTSSGASYTSNTAILSVTGGAEIAPNASAKFYAAVKPFTAKAGSDLTVKVSATSATGYGAHEKDLTLSSDVVFASGNLKNVKVDYTTAIEAPSQNAVWTLVTDVATLAADDQVIIAAKDYSVAMSTTQNSNNRGQANITKNGTILDTPGSTVQIFTLKAGTASGTWAFYSDGPTKGYIYAASSSSNHLKTQTTNNANGSWEITIKADGTASVVAQGSNSRKVMQYNQSSSLFACYSSASQKAVAIYKLATIGGDDTPSVPAPVLTVNPTTIEGIPYEGGTASFTYTVANPVDGVSATATSSEDWVTITPIEGAFNLTIAANEDKARTATITVSYDGAVSRTVTVEQEAKPNDDGGVDIVLDFQTMQNGVSAYTATWEQTCGDYIWNIVNFNNNNKGWKYIRCGSKNNASVASINTTFSIPWAVSSVVVTIDSATVAKVNSTYLVVATDANFSNVVETINVTIKTGNLTYAISNPGANYYYKVVYDCQKGTSSGFVQISKVVYTAQ